MRVLVADDDPSLRFLCRAALESAGHEVFLADDGSHVLERVEAHGPELLLMDVSMPYMGGLEVLKSMTVQQREELPVVLLSARSRVVERVEGIEAGAIAYVTKPFQPESLIRIVNDILGMTREERRTYRHGMLESLRNERLRQSLVGGRVSLAIDLREGFETAATSLPKDNDSRREARRQTAVAALALSAVTGAGFSELVDEMVFTAADVLPVRRVAVLECASDSRLICRSVAGDGDLGSLAGKWVSQSSAEAFLHSAESVFHVAASEGIFLDAESGTTEVWVGIPGCDGPVGVVAVECGEGECPKSDDLRFLQVCAGIMSALGSSTPRPREHKPASFSGFMRRKR
jgi:DNA-binding response OmpR family regulator